jgi:thiamine biosynthesis lipoprotein
MMGLRRLLAKLRPNRWRFLRLRIGRRLAPCCLCLGLLLSGCDDASGYHVYPGQTMGTAYRVFARCPVNVHNLIEVELAAVNAEMSTYQSDSILSQFNAAERDTWFPVSSELLGVLQVAQQLSEESQGAFDVTVGALVNLWGFGPAKFGLADDAAVPSASAVRSALMRVGFEKLRLQSSPPALMKLADIYVDLSAIAKGHGVDRLAARIGEAGCGDYMVEIGGEVLVRGVNPQGQHWRIGIEVPDPRRVGGVHRVLGLRSAAVATSGDYRNYVEHAGKRYSHTIDPRTGSPISHGLASVTVVHKSALLADGYATLLNVLGPEAGWALAEAQNLPALFLVRKENGFDERYTAAMQPFLR